MKALSALLALFVAATLVIVFAGEHGEGVIRMAGYVATLALGGMAALLIQGWKNRRPGTRSRR